MSRVEEALRRSGLAGLHQPEPGPHAIVRERGSDSTPARLEDYEQEQPSHPTPAPVPHRELPATGIAAPRTAVGHPFVRLSEEVEGKLVVDSQTDSASVEQYRRLAATLHQMQAQGSLRSLMVSSAMPRDGKTLTSTNLALTLSESHKRRVLLIDADLRRPSIHTVFRIPNGVGLADSLRPEAGGPLPLIEVSSHLSVIPAGSLDATPMAGLTSERMRVLLKEASVRFDWVISDANLLADLVDGVLLVIGAGSTSYPALKRAISEIGRERIIGVVLNRADADPNMPVARYQHYYPSDDENGSGTP
jgi:capsular exopolysaccharide synthesis family protein